MTTEGKIQAATFSDSGLIDSGLIDPVFDAQRVFRSTLDALARPGLPMACAINFPARFGVPPAALAVLLSLLDSDVSLWVGPMGHRDLVRYLRFHCGVGIVSDPAAADFALIDIAYPDALSVLPHFSRGTAMSPEQSTTVVVSVEDFVSGSAVELEGPGCDGTVRFAPAGFNHEAWNIVIDNRSDVPLGTDLLLCCGRDIVGLPRSTRIIERAPATTGTPSLVTEM